MAVYMGEQIVESGPVRLSVREYGDEQSGSAAPHVVLVHGYPDDQTMWDGVVERLSGAHVITYDVRGAGRSSVPTRIRDYRNDRLTDDLVAVVEATIPSGEPFTLVGHDWGSIQHWDSVTDPRLAHRITSYVSASGPSIDHVGAAFRGVPPKGLISQLAHSFYIGVFQVPLLPERLWRSKNKLTPGMVKLLREQGGEAEWNPELAHNAGNGVQLYRANMLPKLARPKPERIELPVVLVAATQDTFVGPVYVDMTEKWCSDVRRVEIDAPHFHPRCAPELLAGIVGYELSAAKRT
jgi:pimeloyl-ACP methyl ester carboxylesterase